MSLAAPYQEHYYVADGLTTSFAFGQSFTALNEIDVKCIIYFEDGTNCVPVFNVNMTTGFINIVSLTKPDGTLLTVPPAGSIVRVFRKTPEAQNVTASQLQNYTAKQLERVFDSLVAMIQEISYSDIHKTVRLTETQRDIAIDYLPDDKDQAVIYWDVEERKLMPAGFGQNQVVKSDGVEWLVYNQSEGKVYFIPRQGGNPIPIGKATIHNDLSGRNAPDCHPESAITGLREHLQELRDKDSEIEGNVDIALNRSQEAVDTAEEAKLIAEYAQSQVAQAQQTAEEAKQIAEGVDAKAQEALDNSGIALDNANEALEKVEQEKSDRQSADATLQDNIDQEALSRSNADVALQNQITANKSTMDSHIADTSNPHSVTKAQVGLGNVDNTSDLDKPISTATQEALDDITDLIPAQATAQNQLADKAFVNSSIETNTATFRGTYNTLAELEAQTADNNDYGFVVSTDSAGNTVYNRYKYNGAAWTFEYALNNSSFTASQWAAINSNATAEKIAQIDTNTTNIANHIADTNNPHSVTKAQVGLGNVDNTSDLNKPISTATQTALNGKQNTISDLATIRGNAQAGKSASDTIANYGDIVSYNAANFATAAQGAKADTAVQPSDLATVATTGSYNDLSNKPTIPTVGNGTITITQGGISKGTFTTNQSGDTTIELEAGAGDVYSKVETDALLDNKANTDMDNLTSTGANIANWSSNVSNCITNIPQDIKLELNNGALTLKAGSKVYVPNGSGVFNELIIQNDLTTITSWGEQVRLGLFVKSDGSTMFIINMEERCSSGSTPPTATNTQMWYDTTNNLVKRYAGGSDTGDRYSLPIALVQKGDAVESSNISRIDQIFNGMGFVGSCIFVLPKVEVCLPNGKNADGTRNNIKKEITNVQIIEMSQNMATRTCAPIVFSQNGLDRMSMGIHERYWGTVAFLKDLANVYTYYSCYYCIESNRVYYRNGQQVQSIQTWAFVGNIDVSSDDKITKLEIKQAFQAVDYNDKEFFANQAMPSTKIQNLSIGASGSQYIAPADGYFTLGISGSGFAELATPKASASANWSTGGWARATIPVAKGETMSLFYGSVGTWRFFNFIYAIGAK